MEVINNVVDDVWDFLFSRGLWFYIFWTCWPFLAVIIIILLS